MNIGNGEVIEVQHPQPTDTANEGDNRLHLGPIGSGKDIRSESERIDFARTHGLLATDVEMSSVLDSIIGNCRDSFIIVKGKYYKNQPSLEFRFDVVTNLISCSINRYFGLQRRYHNEKMAKLCIACCSRCNEVNYMCIGCTNQCLVPWHCRILTTLASEKIAIDLCNILNYSKYRNFLSN